MGMSSKLIKYSEQFRDPMSILFDVKIRLLISIVILS